MKYEMIKLTMSDGNINVIHSWKPTKVDAVVVLSHGMTEHAARYENFASVLAGHNIALIAEDHRGHGQTAKLAKENGTGDFGYLADKNGFFRVTDDIREEIEYAKEIYPGKKVFLFGHSFGSFVAQCYVEKYGDSIDGAIICGSAGPRRGLIAVAKCMGGICKIFGKKRINKFLNKLAFGTYNAKIKNPESPFDWLSRDKENIKKYVADPWCGFVCTTSFYCDLFAGLSYIHKSCNMKKVPHNLPVYFIVGTADPVGNYAKTVIRLTSIYKKNGMENVDLSLYEGARHELLNEINKDEVEQDVLEWLKRQMDA